MCGPGYGNAPPATTGGRIFCVFYGLFGLPLFIIAAYGIGDRLFHGVDRLRVRIYEHLLKRKAPPRRFVYYFVYYRAFQSLQPVFGTVFRSTSRLHRLFPPSEAV